MKHFAGVDTHRDSHSVVIINELGEVVERLTIPTTSEAYAETIAQSKRHGEVLWGLEGIGSYGRSFADSLLRAGAIVYEVPGMISKRSRRRLRHRGKSDIQDAHAIAEAVLRERDTLPRHLAADAEEATRLLYERRDRKVRERTEKINRIRALALYLQLELAKDLTSDSALDKLEAALNSRTIGGYADFEVVDELRDLVADIRRILGIIADLEKRLRPFVERLAPRLLELRGCSIISAAGLIGHTGPIVNYRSADAFASHAGTAPIPCSSGKHTSVRLNIAGNRQLNRCLHTIANVQARSEGHLGKVYYDRKRAEGKTHREAMRCLKRQLADVVFRLLQAAVPASSMRNAA